MTCGYWPGDRLTQVSGSLPPGLTLGCDGTLTGTPAQAGSYTFSVQAANPIGTYDASLTVAIAPAMGPPWPGKGCVIPPGCSRRAGGADASKTGAP